MKKPLKKGMVFGTFDGYHPGHVHFLNEAKNYAENLVVVVAVPETILALKKRGARRSLEERMRAVQAHDSSLLVVQGDAVLGEWLVLKKHKPGIVILGYDQDALGAEIEKLGIETARIAAHFPKKYKSSLLS